MPRETSAISDSLSDSRQANSPEGLMLRYARGRVRFFAGRQIVTVLGALVLWVTLSPMAGLFVLGAALAGEILDCLYLRRVPALLQRGVPLHRIDAISTGTAGIQALTITICVFVAWTAHEGHAEPLFGIGFLTSAALNAALLAPLHRNAAIARLTIYGLAPLTLFARELVHGFHLEPVYLQNLAGSVMLIATVVMFLQFAVQNFNRTRRYNELQERQNAELEKTNLRLLEKREQARRLAAVAEHANDSVILMDRDGTIGWVNRAFTAITGYTSAEAIGRNPGALLNSETTDPDTVNRLAEVREKGQPFRCEILNRAKDGREFWVETNQVPVLDSDGRVEVVVAVERDVTAARDHAAELEDARQAAEDGARVKEEFLATMSHEIRTPMNGVLGMAQLLSDTALDADQTLYTETILSSASTLLDLINDVLDLSKLDAGQMELSTVDFDPRDCFEGTLQLLRPQAAEKGLELRLDVADSVPQTLCGDDRRIRQILLNLAGNAVKFTREGHVTVRLSAREQGAMGIELTCAVEDTGIGIPEDKLDHVFRRFSQADAATTRQFGGTGLGLTISRRLTEAMGGSISVSSDPGRGSCFTVTLLLEPSSTAQAAGTADAADTDCTAVAGLRVLVAEDNKVNRLVISKFLRGQPIQLEFAKDGGEAVSKCRNLDPDLVFMDMSMPVLSGIDATRRIRESTGRQPVIIALTANAFASDRKACLDAGMNGFLSKPVSRTDLLTALRDCGEGRAAAEAG